MKLDAATSDDITMTDWLPIESAPKDGSRILVNVNGHAQIARWECVPHFASEWSDEIVEGFCWVLNTGSSLIDTRTAEPTQWMPLPTCDA